MTSEAHGRKLPPLPLRRRRSDASSGASPNSFRAFRNALVVLTISTAVTTTCAAADRRPAFRAVASFAPGVRHRTSARRSGPSELVKLGSSDIADSYARWDNLYDDDDDDDDAPKKRVPSDMRYEVRNIHRQASNYDAIRGAGGRDLVSDVYMRSPGDEMAWLVGRVASVSDAPTPRAIDRQFPLIERHGWLLRPVDLHPRRGPFEVWYTEVGELDEAVVALDPSVKFHRVEEDDVKVDEGSKQDVRAAEVGFKAIAYADDDVEGDGEPVWARLTADGRIAMSSDILSMDQGGRGEDDEDEDLAVASIEDVMEKMSSAASLEGLLDDTDFQD